MCSNRAQASGALVYYSLDHLQGLVAPLLKHAGAGISRWGNGQGIGDSGAGVLGRECEICQQSCPFPITVDFQCPHKVNQVHNRRSFSPRSDGCFSLLRLFLFPPDSWSPIVCVTCLQRCPSVPGKPRNLLACFYG